MPGTRRSARLSGGSSSQPDNISPQAGSKRKADESQSPKKRERKAAKQQTLEKSASSSVLEGQQTNQDTEREAYKLDSATDAKSDDVESNGHSNQDVSQAKTSNGEAIEKDDERAKNVPTNILEKGIIYFFTRGRVGVEQPEAVSDLQRTYFVLRPLPNDAKIGDGAMPDSNNLRLFALPKKVFPKNGRDRYMAFVEKAGVSMKQLKEDFLQGSDYETKTSGTRHTPPVTPVGEGVYAMTMTGRTSHLVYMLTIPKQPADVQEDMGIREKGNFITSLKNPTQKGPVNARLPEDPEFPKEILEDFNGRGWMPIQKANYLDYSNAQILLIGESRDKFDGALEPTDKDKHNSMETPREELEKLEGEDQIRIEHLDHDNSVFHDLHINKKDYPEVLTTW